MKGKNIFKISKFHRILFIVIFLIFFSGIIMILRASQINEYPNYSKYSFSFFAFSENGSIVNFSNFRVNYHFDEETGTFSIKTKEKLHKMTIYMPEAHKIISVQHFQNSGLRDFPFELEKSENEKLIRMTFLNETNDEWILINFKMKLSPNGKFEFSKNSFWGAESHFYFNMGNKFECTRQDCFFNLLNVEVDRSSLGTQQESSSSLKFINQVIEGSSLDFQKHEFEISARSRDNINKRTFWISFGSSIIAGAIFALFSLIIIIVQEIRKKEINIH